MKNAIAKATILSQALPYIQQYNKKIIVIKYGGNAMQDETLKQNVINDIVLLSAIGVKVVVVHGGGPKIDEILTKMNQEIKFIDGLRYTDEDCMEVVQMVLAGKMNKDLVSMIHQAGSKAVGISGMDAGLLKVEPFPHTTDLGYVGKIIGVDEQIVFDLLDNGYIPVIASVGCDENNHSYNVNADLAAASIAAKLQAENIILVSNIPGLLENPKQEETLISQVSTNEIQELKKRGIIAGGMIPKVDCCVEAIACGVKKACIIDGRIPHSLLIEILSDDGIGTMIMGEQYEL